LKLSADLEEAIGAAGARVRTRFPVWLRPFLMRDVVAITLGRRIYLSARATEAAGERLLRHELVHVQQINRLGLFRFYWLYVAEFLRNLRGGMKWDEAYRRISFEQEALAAERPRLGTDV
jgi:hypothetical protein